MMPSAQSQTRSLSEGPTYSQSEESLAGVSGWYANIRLLPKRNRGLVGQRHFGTLLAIASCYGLFV